MLFKYGGKMNTSIEEDTNENKTTLSQKKPSGLPKPQNVPSLESLSPEITDSLSPEKEEEK